MNICLPLKPFTAQLSSDLHGEMQSADHALTMSL